MYFNKNHHLTNVFGINSVEFIFYRFMTTFLCFRIEESESSNDVEFL